MPSPRSVAPPPTPLSRPRRTESLMVLSGAGLIGADLDQAIAYADRARFVQYAAATKKLLKVRRITKLELSDPVPPWIGELRHLRTLICSVGKRLPAALLTLPHLRYLRVARGRRRGRLA